MSAIIELLKEHLESQMCQRQNYADAMKEEAECNAGQDSNVDYDYEFAFAKGEACAYGHCIRLLRDYCSDDVVQ